MANVRMRVGLAPCTEAPESDEYDPAYLDKRNRTLILFHACSNSLLLTDQLVIAKGIIDRVSKLSAPTLENFLEQCLTKYERSKVEPGK